MQSLVPTSASSPDIAGEQAPYRELMQSLLALEERCGLFQLQIAEAPCWEYLRLRVYFELVQRLGLLAIVPQRRPRTTVELARLGWGAARSAFATVAGSDEPAEIAFFGYSRRVRHEDGIWYDPHVDPLLEGLPWSHVYIEQRHRRRYYRPVVTSRRVQHDYFDLRAAIARKRKPWRLSASDACMLQEIGRELFRVFGVAMDLGAVAQAILDRRRCLIPLYQRFFARARPKLLVVLSPNCAEMAALEAARSLGIHTAELQHGVIGSYDPAYSFPSSAQNLKCIADDLLLLDDFWREKLCHPPSGPSFHTIGFSYLDEARRIYVTERTDQTVFLSQPTIGEGLSKFAVALARHPRRTGQIVYRLHPDEANWRSLYPWLVDAPVEVDDGGNRPLRTLLAESRSQIGVYSFALFEGLAFGLRTYLFNAPGVEALDGVVGRSWGRVVNSVEDILDDPAAIVPAAPTEIFPQNANARFHAYLTQTIGAPSMQSLPAAIARSA